jgi:kynurenine formamidase
MKLIDLTHTFTADMPVYPGDPKPQVTQAAHISKDGYNDCCLHGGMHIGTHMDAPWHMIAAGAKMSEIPVTQFFGRGVLVDACSAQTVEAARLDGVGLNKGDIVLVMTGWSARFRSPDYYGDFPTIEPAFAERLVAAQVSILGLDTPSPDRPPFAVHKILLSRNILIIENLTGLDALAGAGAFDVSAAPAKFDWDAAPVRVVAHLQDESHSRQGDTTHLHGQ